MLIPHDQIDSDAQKVVRRLTRNGFSAYLVGGCVRDLLLGRKPKDFDVATSATPPEIKALFRNCRIIGRRFRLAHIFFGPKIIETSTFRANPRDVEIAEGESPEATPELSETELLIRRDNVFGSAEEDARRRDFTINGLFYDLDADKVIDYVEGLPDLERRMVRTIGDPDIRFREDPIRILRALKFAARLDFDIEPVAYGAILDHRGEIAKCAPPRVLEEIYRLLRGGAARRSLELCEETGVLEVLIPELAHLLSSGDPVRSRIYGVLDGLDAAVRAGEAPSNALLVSAILAPALEDILYEPDGEPFKGDVALAVDERARPILESMRASRRDTERARQILLVQRRLGPSKKRRNRPMTLVKRDWFAEALAIYQLMHRGAEGEVAEEIARWHRLMRDSHSAPHGDHAEHGEGAAHERGEPAAEAAAADGEPRKRRRRRRGGRRRRRGGGDDAGVSDGGPLAAKSET
ncbi:MAG TPA: polynucleotide adenylyltransferase PcnB [Polyangia bacterium]|nr:polynucleotide adenylyltransferase PcnB [Polyangia bacterium]